MSGEWRSQELLEWVIRKETELNQLEPLRADAAALQQQQEDARSLLSQLSDRQALISSKLSAARAVSSEPALHCEASDTEGRGERDGYGRERRSELDQSLEQARAIGREAAKLQDKWRELGRRAELFRRRADSALAKRHVLERCMNEVEQRLNDIEQTQPDVVTNGDVAEDRLLEVQRSLDDVMPRPAGWQRTMCCFPPEHAARLATLNGRVPLSPEHAARLAALNGRLHSVASTVSAAYGGPPAPPDLGRSVEPPWERSQTEHGVPYYLHHGERRTQWDHPRLDQLMRGLPQLDAVRFSAYRTALKLRRLQRALLLHRLPLAEAAQAFEAQAWRLPATGLVAVPDVVAVLVALYGGMDPPVTTDLALRMDLCLNWLLSVYDNRRTGRIPVSSFKLAIITLCKAHLEEKYRYMFQLGADNRQRLNEKQLGRLLSQLLQLPGQMGEEVAFGPAAVQPSVTSCFPQDEKEGEQETTLCEAEVLDWLRAEPQSLVWLPVLHRVAGAEKSRHHARCNGCKEYPIVGFRYRCLKCFNFDMCQQCFFTGRVAKSHKLSHPMHEYCTESSSSDDIKDFTRSIRNRFKSKHYFRKHAKLGYLPVQPMAEGVTSAASADHLRTCSLDQGARTNGHATSEVDAHSFSSPESEDELQLITQYCMSLSSEGVSDETRDEQLRAVIRQLEQENRALQAEYQRLARAGPAAPAGLPAAAAGPPTNAEPEAPRAGDDADPPPALPASPPPELGRESSKEEEEEEAPPPVASSGENAPPPAAEEPDGGRPEGEAPLQTRMQELDEHNRQLGQRLSKLRRLLNGGTNLARSSTLQTRSVTASQLASDSPAPEGGCGRPIPLAFSLPSREQFNAELLSA
ncbi:LOW QUALITY PROTEIN: dystrophin-like [Pollicipes pollicipes]|uniref:LOW QUALITY PROTEIN: dystrophin-like n=1 Tax=Pollicipes pollicipes TaxID=41117 RepID=UPI001884DC23|nr:LOW QUALITY PROTEIN: dystrophin-like [Pollicipes pollicipes]